MSTFDAGSSVRSVLCAGDTLIAGTSAGSFIAYSAAGRAEVFRKEYGFPISSLHAVNGVDTVAIAVESPLEIPAALVQGGATPGIMLGPCLAFNTKPVIPTSQAVPPITAPSAGVPVSGGWVAVNGSTTGGLVVLDTKSSDETRIYVSAEDKRYCHSQPVTSIEFIPSFSILMTGGGDGLIKIWNAATSPVSLMGVCEGHTRGVTGITFAAGERIWSCSLDGTVRIWNTSAACEQVLVPAPDAALLAAAAGGGAAGAGAGASTVSSSSPVLCMSSSLNLDGTQYVMVGTEAGHVTVYSTADRSLGVQFSSVDAVTSLSAVSSNGVSYIAVGHRNGSISIRDLDANLVAHLPDVHKSPYTPPAAGNGYATPGAPPQPPSSPIVPSVNCLLSPADGVLISGGGDGNTIVLQLDLPAA